MPGWPEPFRAWLARPGVKPLKEKWPMQKETAQLSRREKLGIVMLIAPAVVLGFAMAPGWGFDFIGGLPTVAYQIVAGCAGVAGAVLLNNGPRVLFVMLIGCAVAEIGAIEMIARHLANVEKSNTIFIVLMAICGAVPGGLIALVLSPAEKRLRGL